VNRKLYCVSPVSASRYCSPCFPLRSILTRRPAPGVLPLGFRARKIPLRKNDFRSPTWRGSFTLFLLPRCATLLPKYADDFKRFETGLRSARPDVSSRDFNRRKGFSGAENLARGRECLGQFGARMGKLSGAHPHPPEQTFAGFPPTSAGANQTEQERAAKEPAARLAAGLNH
jgi:hypothetical protein